MSADYTKIAFYDIRGVLWQELQNANLLDYNDYYADGFNDGMVPIIPAQEIPEFNNLLPGKTYMVYDIVKKNIGVSWWLDEETATFSVVSRSQNQIQTIINFMVDVFRRYDKSAKEMQLEIAENSPFKFHYFKLDSADPVQAFSDEGGFMLGNISISYASTRDLDPVTGRYL